MNVYIVNLHGFRGRHESVGVWEEEVAKMDHEHRLMLEGGGLSSIFLGYPLRIVNPVFVGGFYGILIGIVLLPMALLLGEPANWQKQVLGILAITSSLGAFSLVISSIVKRPPIRLERKRRYLFPVPFLGLLILSLESFYELESVVGGLGMVLLIAPGPIYVQLSYAPRWRILNRIQEGKNPFDGMEVTIYSEGTEEETVIDSEMEEVVGGPLSDFSLEIDNSRSD